MHATYTTERLHGLLSAGLSACAAADALGTTKSAILARVKRLRDAGTPGWEPGAFDANRSAIQIANSVSPRAADSRRLVPVKKKTPLRKPAPYLNPAAPVRVGLPLFDYMPEDRIAQLKALAPVSRRIPLLDRKLVECSWIEGDDALCCGAPVVDRSFCAAHLRIAYRPGSAKKGAR